MRAGLLVLIVVVMSRPELARSQADLDAVHTIPIHPGVTTMLQLPDEVEDTWITHRGEIRVASKGNEVAVRPHAGTPAGVEASLEIKTGTMYRTFRLRVVARAKDASRNVLVLTANAERDTDELALETPPLLRPPPAAPAVSAVPAAPAPAVPAKAEPVAPAEPAEAVAPAEPAEAVAPAEPVEPVAPATARDHAADSDLGAATVGPAGFDLFVHAALGLGATAVNLAGYEPRAGLQFHSALSARLVAERRGASWGLEVDVSGEQLAGPLTYGPRDEPASLEMSGPWLQAMLGMRLRFGTRWIPSAYAGAGAQAHLRATKAFDRLDASRSSTMKRGVVLGLGVGLQYRARDTLLGIEFQVREGAPDEYRSIGAFFTVGRFLDQGE